MNRRRGFTLIELMVVVVVISLLAAIAVPKFSALLAKSKEGATKGNLGSLRSALSIYYGDNTFYPTAVFNTNSPVLIDALIPKYMDTMPSVRLGGLHPDSALVFAQNSIVGGGTPDGDAGWVYDSQPPGFPSDSDLGSVWVSCTHTDTKNSDWSSY